MKRLLSLILLVLVALAACGRDNDPVVARVDGIDILASDVRIHMEQSEEMVLWDHQMLTGEQVTDFNRIHPSGMTFYRTIREEAVRVAASYIVFLEMAAELNIGLSEFEQSLIDNEIERNIDLFGEDEYRAMLREGGYRDIDQRAGMYAFHFILNNMIEFLLTNETYFEAFAHHMPPEPVYPDLYGAMHILTMFDHFDTYEEAYAFASALLERVNAGEDFAMLMSTYSHDHGLLDFPAGYTFAEGNMQLPFEQATRALEIGETSGLVETVFGYHIIKRTEPDVTDWYRLLRRQPTTLQDRMVEAIFIGIQERADNANLEILPALDDL